MGKQICLTSIALTILVGVPGFAVAQSGERQGNVPNAVQNATLAATYSHGPRPLPARVPSSASDRGVQSEQQIDSGVNPAAEAARFVTFEVPGAATGNGQGTVPLDINPAGEVTGFYLDANDESHGFLRARDGSFTTFDPPDSVQTAPGSINSRGDIAGYYLDANATHHGFVRARDGAITTFDFPVGSTTFFPGNSSINARGAVAGYYMDSGGLNAFVRTPDGTLTSFDAPGASSTFANSINPAGTIAGYDVVVTTQPSFSLVFHGLLRAPNGAITIFDVPGALDTFAVNNSINPAGVIAGFYYDTNMTSHGYLRAPDGAFSTFDVPGAGTGQFQGTGLIYMSINPKGAIAGTYVDASNVYHGFVRARDGSITAFDPSGSFGTFPDSINPAGTIAGYYEDANNAAHGFLRIKNCRGEGYDHDCDAATED